MFGLTDPSRSDDPFGLWPLLDNLGLASVGRRIVASCRPCVAVEVVERRGDLPHTASCLGGLPALPDSFAWPLGRSGEPMRFLAQFACSELSLAKLDGFPEEGLVLIFLDTTDDEPMEARVHHFSLAKDLSRRAAPELVVKDHPAYRPSFHAIPSLPRPGSVEYEALALDDDHQDAYYQLLLDLEDTLEVCHLRCGGHPPFSDEEGCYPTRGKVTDWEFFLAVRDVEELDVLWPETGCAMIWVPRGAGRFVEGRAELTWQTVVDDWEEDEDEESDEDEEGDV